MNKRERRERYLSTRRPAEYLEKRKQWQESNIKWKVMCEKYDFEDLSKRERYNVLIKEGFIDPSITFEHFGVEE